MLTPWAGTGSMRVVCVRDHLQPSGGTDDLLRLFTAMGAGCVQVLVLVLSGETTETARFVTAGIRVEHLYKKYHSLRRIRQLSPQRLLLSGTKSSLWGGLAALLYHIPCIVYFNHMLAVSSVQLHLQRFLLNRNRHVVATSKAAADWVSSRYRIPLENIVIVHPGIDLTAFSHGVDHAPPKNLVISVIGRMVLKDKGQDIMLSIWPTILARFPDATLRFIGDGPDLAQIKKTIRHSPELNHSVIVTGQRDDIPGQITASSLVVVPSLCYEGFGLVPLEAAASARPCVAFASGGLVEAVDDGKTGLLVTRGDTHALSAAVLRILHDDELRMKLGQAGPAFASRFSIDLQAKRVTEVLQAVGIIAAD